MVALAEKALFTLHHVFTAAGTHAHNRPPGAGQDGGSRLCSSVGFHKTRQHFPDPGHKFSGGKLAPLHLTQLFLPLGGQLGGFQLVGHDTDQFHALLRRDKALFLPFRKAGAHQPLNHPCAGSGRTQPSPLHILQLGKILGAGVFHGRKQGVLGEPGGRGRGALMECGGNAVKPLPLRQFRERRGLFLLFRLAFQRIKIRTLRRFPALFQRGSAFGRKGSAAALQYGGALGVSVGLAHGAQQAGGDHV